MRPNNLSKEATRIVCVVSSLPVGGGEKALITFLENLDPRLFNPTVICLDELGELGAHLLEMKTASVYWKFSSVRPRAKVLWNFLKVLKYEQPDLILDAITRARTQVLVTFAKLAINVPAVAWVHNTGRFPPRLHQEFVERICLPFYDRLIAVGSRQAEGLCTRLRLKKKKVSLVYNGLPLGPFARILPTVEAKRKLGIAPTTPVIGITAQLRPEKDHETLFSAMKIITQRIPDVLLLVLGGGIRQEYLENKSRCLDLKKNIVFLGQHDNIADIVAAYDIGVLSSKPFVETLPLAVIEYMLSGKPTVATKVGSVSDLILDGKTGFLVPPGNSTALAERILFLLENSHWVDAMGKAARVHAQESFLSNAMVDKMQTVLLDVIGKTA